MLTRTKPKLLPLYSPPASHPRTNQSQAFGRQEGEQKLLCHFCKWMWSRKAGFDQELVLWVLLVLVVYCKVVFSPVSLTLDLILMLHKRCTHQITFSHNVLAESTQEERHRPPASPIKCVVCRSLTDQSRVWSANAVKNKRLNAASCCCDSSKRRAKKVSSRSRYLYSAACPAAALSAPDSRPQRFW